MKLISILTLFAVSLISAPTFTHPNYNPALPPPVIAETFPIELPKLETENPQWSVYFEGGLVGLFGRIPAAPIWTTPAVFHPDVEHPWMWVYWIRNNDCPPSEVPEPLTYILICLGLFVIYWLPKREDKYGTTED